MASETSQESLPGSPQMWFQRSRLRQILKAAQKSSQIHGKLFKELKRLRGVSESEERFREDLILCLKHLMVSYERQPNVERVIDFAVKYAVTADDDLSLQVGVSLIL